MVYGWDRERRQEMSDWGRQTIAAHTSNLRAAPAGRPITAAAAARHAELSAQLRKESATARIVNPPSRFSTVSEFQLVSRRDRRKLLRSGNDDAPCTANRLAHMPNVQAGMVARMPCKRCRRKQLVASAKHEIQQGLHSVLGLWCTECRQVTEWVPLSELLPSGRRGPDLAAIHVRAQMGMAEAGMDRASANRYHAGLDLPGMSRGVCSRARQQFNRAAIAVAQRSKARALQVEELRAYEAGSPIDDDGRVGIGISFDGQWNSPRKSRNAMECKAAAIGELTGKVVASGYLTKDCAYCKRHGAPCGRNSCNRTFSGPSGNMESAIGATIVKELNASPGAYVRRFCADLDTQLAKEIRLCCAATGDDEPVEKIDANHTVKAFGGKLLPDAKKAVGQRGVLSKPVAERLTKQLSYALQRHKTCGCTVSRTCAASILHLHCAHALPMHTCTCTCTSRARAHACTSSCQVRLKGALENVIDHAFNRHDNCLRYFDCPVALGKDTKSSYNSSGEWLDVLGGGALETELRAQFRKRLTSDAQLEKLEGGMSTQRNESLHTMQRRMAPKSYSYGGSSTGRARQASSHSVWNDGSEATAVALETELGLPHGEMTACGLAIFDSERQYHRKREREPAFKAKRRSTIAARKKHDAPQPGQRGPSYRPHAGWDDDSGEESSDEDEEAHDWVCIEVTKANLARSFPEFRSLRGADVCVLAAAYPDVELAGHNSIGWRGQITGVAGIAEARKVQVFSSWFKLNDASIIRPLKQE